MPASLPIRNTMTRLVIILGLGLVIFLPRPLLGWWYLENAASFEAQGLFQQASIAYEEASYRCWWEQGLVEKAAFTAMNASDVKGAIRFFTKSLESGHLSDKGRMALGELLLKEGQLEHALDIWTTIKTGSIYKAGSIFEIAAVETKLGNYDQAVDLWRQGLQLDPSYVLARYNLGLILAAIVPSEAIQELDQVNGLSDELESKVSRLTSGLKQIRQSDEMAMQLVDSGRLLASIQEWDLAYFAFQNSINLDPRISETWAWLGEASHQIGKDPLPSLKRSLELNSASITSLALNGLYYRRMSHPDKALGYYEKAARLDPENANWQVILGELSAEMGDLAAALECYQAAVAISPKDFQTWQAMLDFLLYYQVYIDQVGLEAAVQIFKLEPDSWKSYDDMGQVMMWSGKYDFAEYYFKRSIAIDSNQAESHLHFGLLFLLRNMDADAVPELQKAVTLEPGSSAGLQAIQLLEQYSP
jgi:tetratricopeptide (TPR) repeat protein